MSSSSSSSSSPAPAQQQQQRGKQAVMDQTQLQKMTEVLSADLRAMKEQLEAQRKENESIKKVRTEQDAELERLKKTVDAVREEKRQSFAKVMESEVDPFLQNLRESGSSDERFVESIDAFKDSLTNGLNEGFMDSNSMASFQTIRAAASANQVTSEKLEQLFQSEKKWKEQLDSLKQMNDEYEAKQKAAEEEKTLNSKMLDDLKKELAQLKAVHEKNVSAVENHFDGSDDSKMQDANQTATATATATDNDNAANDGAASSANAEAPSSTNATDTGAKMDGVETVTATASAGGPSYVGGFETLFDFKPTENWRHFKTDRF